MDVWGYKWKYHDEDITYHSTLEQNSNYCKLYIIILAGSACSGWESCISFFNLKADTYRFKLHVSHRSSKGRGKRRRVLSPPNAAALILSCANVCCRIYLSVKGFAGHEWSFSFAFAQLTQHKQPGGLISFK